MDLGDIVIVISIGNLYLSLPVHLCFYLDSGIAGNSVYSPPSPQKLNASTVQYANPPILYRTYYDSHLSFANPRK